ncbi:MAG TPA: hypothetical protein VGI16_13810 [Candidatus Acidoferrum sp.]|jgi:hypothetical protein
MSNKSPTKKVFAVVLLSSVCALLGPIAIAAQQPPPKPEQKPPASPTVPPSDSHKVWLNEDLVALRTPSDVYLLAKETREAAEAQAAAEQAEKLANPDAPHPNLPNNIEDTEAAIATTKEDIVQGKRTLARLIQELAQTSGDQERAKQKEIDRVTSNVVESQRNLNALQDNLEALKTKPNDDEATPATTPPPATPPPATPPPSSL